MGPLSVTGALLTKEHWSVQPVSQTSKGTVRAPGVSELASSRPAGAPVGPALASPSSSASLALSTMSPQAVIRQAEMLLQIASINASSPALRQIANAAYQMEIDARRDLVRTPMQGNSAGREWFA